MNDAVLAAFNCDRRRDANGYYTDATVQLLLSAERAWWSGGDVKKALEDVSTTSLCSHMRAGVMGCRKDNVDKNTPVKTESGLLNRISVTMVVFIVLLFVVAGVRHVSSMIGG